MSRLPSGRPRPAINCLQHFVRRNPELQSGPHLKYIGASLVGGAERGTADEVSQSHKIASSIMDASSKRDPDFAEAMNLLAMQKGPLSSVFKHKKKRYDGLEANGERNLPDEFDLMVSYPDLTGLTHDCVFTFIPPQDKDLALETFLRMAEEQDSGADSIDSITEAVMRLSVQEQSDLAKAVTRSEPGRAGVDVNLLPLGLELK